MPLFTPELEFSDDYPTIEPSLKLDFANSRALDPRITFERDSVATYVGSDGLIKTAGVNEPRFDHDPVTGESLGLLVEEGGTFGGTNLFEYSEDFTNADWTKFDVSISSNSIIAPDGSTNSYTITEGTANSQHNITDTTNTTGTKTFSVFAKLASGSRLFRLVDYNATDGAVTGRFDLSNGTIDAGSDSSAVIKDFGNGWYRCSITTTTTVESNYYISLCQSDSTFTYIGDGSSSFYIFGAQLEASSFASSYIPTSGATATRDDEIVYVDGVSVNTYNPEEGTHLIEFRGGRQLSDGDEDATILSYKTDGFDRTLIGSGTNNGVSIFPSATTISYSINSQISGSNHITSFKTAAFAYSGTTSSLASDGSVVNGTWDRPQFNNTDSGTVYIGHFNFPHIALNGHIKKYHYYPKRVSDTQLQTLTQ